MLYSFLADLTVILHLAFIVFVVAGGLLVFRWPRLAWLHVPAFLWGGAISLLGWICPLTHLENDLRAKGLGSGYETSFVEEYVMPIIYPEQLFGSFPRAGFIMIGIGVLLLNTAVYWRVYRSRQHGY